MLLEIRAGARLRNAMIFKPRTDAADGRRVEKIMLEAGVPPGVFQVVQGHSEVGRR